MQERMSRSLTFIAQAAILFGVGSHAWASGVSDKRSQLADEI